jgi:hypothetical protein
MIVLELCTAFESESLRLLNRLLGSHFFDPPSSLVCDDSGLITCIRHIICSESNMREDLL